MDVGVRPGRRTWEVDHRSCGGSPEWRGSIAGWTARVWLLTVWSRGCRCRSVGGRYDIGAGFRGPHPSEV